MIKPILFAVLSAGIVFLSRKSLFSLRTHGFFRFFAFECLLGLVLLNTDYWFRRPFSPPQLLSWLLLAGSLAMAAHGFYLLKVAGKPQKGIEDTTVLVRRGVYRYIRHPLYTSLLLLGWGAFLKDVSLFSTAFVLLATAFVYITARIEETENREKFGASYEQYMKSTKMFIPFLL
jgi:protein-S-isoprenylcysteine O-methyltransferase Ste14